MVFLKQDILHLGRRIKMARGINKVILVGNVGNDIEVKFLPSGGAVVQTSIATSRSWKDKNTGEQQEHTEWHRVVFFNRLAEVVGEYVVKGSKLYVEGSLRTNKWQDKDGNDRYTTEVIASEMQMLDGKGEGPVVNKKPQQAKNNSSDTQAGHQLENSRQDPDFDDQTSDFGDDDIPF